MKSRNMNAEPNPEPFASSSIFDPFPYPQLFPENWDLSEMVTNPSTREYPGDLSSVNIASEYNGFAHGE